MHWQSDVSVAEWIRPLISDDWSTDRTMHMVIPRGFAAYARVFHPAVRRTLPGGVVPTGEDLWRLPSEQSQEIIARFVDEKVTWQQVSADFGTTMHPLAQWHSLTRAETPYVQSTAAGGAEYTGGDQGYLDPELLAAVVETALKHTSTHEGFAGVWEGWGDLVGGMRGIGQGSVTFAEDEGTPLAHRFESLDQRLLENPYGKETWHPGILSDEISIAPRLQLPDRGYVLFAGSLDPFATESWPDVVPWRDTEHEWKSAHGPALMWPEDHAWFLASEIDFDSTLVGGSQELIDAIVADPRLEALALPPNANLTHDGDTING